MSEQNLKSVWFVGRRVSELVAVVDVRVAPEQPSVRREIKVTILNEVEIVKADILKQSFRR